MFEDDGLSIRFWGTRGTTTPDRACPRFGNHTTSAEIRAGRTAPLFVDLGTGAVSAGHGALACGQREFDVFMTHVHSDHVFGAFTFPPFYRRDCTVRIFGVHPGLRDIFGTLISPPYHPLPFELLPATIVFEQLPATGSMPLPAHGCTLAWCPLSHPQGCTGLRFDTGRSALVFATDVEVGPNHPAEDLLHLLREPYPAGLAVIDGFYTESEIGAFRDWGHSSWEAAWATGHGAGVETVLITHHHPRRDDAALEILERTAGGPLWARDGDIWRLRGNHAQRD